MCKSLSVTTVAISIIVSLTVFWTLGGGLEWIDTIVKSYGFGPLTTGVAVIIIFSLISSLLDIPSSLYSSFVLEEKFGFNKLTLKVFFMDMLKGAALSIAIGIPLILLVLWLMESAGDLWWLYAWVALTAFSIVMMWAYPKFISPIFNKFEPLEEGEVLDRVKNLLSKTGFNSDGVLKGMVVSMTMTLVGFAILAWLMNQAWFYTALGVQESSTYMALLLFLLVSPVFTFFIGPIMSRWSRKHEFEADAFAAKQSDAGELISALVGLYKKNAGTLTPDPLYSAFYDSHPPASIRIAHLKQIA